jgi:prepilin-type N-terminal cleavage/methylation domain-containing protein
MFKLFRKKAKGEKGFTLVELVVVVAVLGILATLAIPRIVGIRAEAEANTKLSNQKIVQNAIELFHARTGNYPGTGDVDITTTGTETAHYTALLAALEGTNGTLKAGTLAELKTKYGFVYIHSNGTFNLK